MVNEREHEELGIDDVVEVVASLLGSAPPSIPTCWLLHNKKVPFLFVDRPNHVRSRIAWHGLGSWPR